VSNESNSGGNGIQKASEWWYGLSKKGRRIVIASVAAVAIVIGWYQWATSKEQDPEYQKCLTSIGRHDSDKGRVKAVCGFMWERSHGQ